MDRFLAAQARDPFDPAPMLIHADWLEEHGDPTGAATLRALAGAGIPSLHALARDALLASALHQPDIFGSMYRAEFGDGWGFGDGFMDQYGEGSGAGQGHGDGYGDDAGCGDAYGPARRVGSGDGGEDWIDDP